MPAARRSLVAAVWVLVLSAGSVSPGGFSPASADDRRLEVTVRPLYALEPGRVTVRVRHQPFADDRRMTVEVESPDFYRGSTFPLEGDRARQLHDIVLKALPAGDYRVRVAIDGEAPVEGGGRFRVCHSRLSSDDPTCDPPGSLEHGRR